MQTKTLRALVGALLLGTALVGAGTLSLSPAQAAAITNRAVGVPLQEAQALAAAKNYTAAIAKAREAKAAGANGAEAALIDRAIASWMLTAKDYRGALAAYKDLATRNVGNRAENLQAALGAALQLKMTAEAQAIAAQLGGAGGAAIYIAQGEFASGNFAEALRLARPLAGGNPPSLQALTIIQASCFKMNDTACNLDTLERLVRFYPNAERWHNLLRMVNNTRGLSDEQKLEIFRIRLLVDDIKTATDYQDMAQMALITNYPAEAKSVVEKGVAEKILMGERTDRLAKMTNDRVTADAATQRQLQAQAQADATGNADLKYGQNLLSYGKAAEAEAAIRQGLTEGKITDRDAANIALGRALLGQGKKPDAVRAFGAIPAASKSAPIARLWAIYASR